MLLAKALERFEADRTETMSRQSLHTYRAAVRALEQDGFKSTRDLTRGRLAEWLLKRRERDLAPSTINVQLGAVLSVLDHLERAGLFPLQRLHELRRLRVKVGPLPVPHFLQAEELTRLRLAAMAIHHLAELAVMLGVFAGLRLEEIRGVDFEHMHLEDELPWIFIPKDGHGRGRARTTPIAKAFARDLKARHLPPGPLFPAIHPNSATDRVGKGTLQNWLREARDRADVPRANYFILRHCFASWLRQGSAEISLISGFMGNSERVCASFYSALAPGGHEAIEKMKPTGGPALSEVEREEREKEAFRLSEQRRTMTSEKRRALMAALRGWWSGNVPMGYRLEAGVLVVDPGEAKLVRALFEAYLRLGSAGAAMRELHAKGYRARSGKPLHLPCVIDWLRSPVYCGKIRTGGEVFQGSHEPLVDEDVYAQVLERLGPGRAP
jgi:integrase